MLIWILEPSSLLCSFHVSYLGYGVFYGRLDVD